MKFKGFWKEMAVLYKNYAGWLKKYWFAYILVNVILFIPICILLYWDGITTYISEMKKAKESDKGFKEES